MSERSFYEEKARAEAKATVQAVEAQTSAELVITLRKVSGWYRAADFLFGALVALVAVAAILLLPRSFGIIAVPIDLIVAFLLGVAFCSRTSTLRRLLVPRARRQENVRVASRAAFVDLGVSRTSGRWGVLVYVSMLERDVEVVPDIGVDLGGMGDDWPKAVVAIRAAVGRLDFEAFKAATLALGPLLGRVHPHREDDVNELPDEVSAS
jgi:putative membrane protein